MTIPKKIWQTYSSELKDIPEYIEQMRKSWIDLNPDWEYHYMSDSDCFSFLKSEYGPERAEAYLMLPHGILKGDFWRLHCIAKFGGVYADIDTLCQKPLTSWLDTSKKFVGFKGMNGDDYTFCNWFFASSKNNDLLVKLADIVFNNVISCNITSDGNFYNATTQETYFPFVHFFAEQENSISFIESSVVLHQPFLDLKDNQEVISHLSASWSHSENDSNFREISESFYWDCGNNVDLKIYNTAYNSMAYPGKFGRD